MIERVLKILSATAKPYTQQLWYSRGEPLNNSINLKLGQARQKLLTGASPVDRTQVLKEFN